MESKLFEYAIILQEKRDKDNDVIEEAELVVEPTSIVARNEQQAQMHAARAIPESYVDKLDRLTVVVRPF